MEWHLGHRLRCLPAMCKHRLRRVVVRLRAPELNPWYWMQNWLTIGLDMIDDTPMTGLTAQVCIGQGFVHHVNKWQCPSSSDGPRTRMQAMGKVTVRSSQMPSHGLQVTPLALLLLYDEGCKAWCPGDHRTSCSLCTYRASRALAIAMGGRRMAIGCSQLYWSVHTDSLGLY